MSLKAGDLDWLPKVGQNSRPKRWSGRFRRELPKLAPPRRRRGCIEALT
jgi:hypothetical protein